MSSDELVVQDVPRSVAETVTLLHEALERRGVHIFATIDHARNARSVGLELPDEVVVIFGDPTAGTGLMVDDPRVGVDLPLRILLWNDRGITKAGYRDPIALGEAFELSKNAAVPAKLSAVMKSLLSELSSAA